MTDGPDPETARMHVSQALSRAVHPDAVAHCAAALRALNGDTTLAECPRCGRLGLPEQVRADHDCPVGTTNSGP